MTRGDHSSSELERLRRVYAAYDADGRRRANWTDSASSRLERTRKWEAVRDLLHGFAGVQAGSWVVDLGAGDRPDSVRLLEMQPDLRGILAIDILQERIAVADHTTPLLRPLVADGARLPLADASAGLVYQSTMLSSVLRTDLRRAIFAEIRRILRPGGIFISYDTRVANPFNPNTRPVGLTEQRAAFAGWRQTGHSLTGIPQIQRLLAPWAPALCHLVESIPFLRSHRVFAAVKPES